MMEELLKQASRKPNIVPKSLSGNPHFLVPPPPPQLEKKTRFGIPETDFDSKVISFCKVKFCCLTWLD